MLHDGSITAFLHIPVYCLRSKIRGHSERLRGFCSFIGNFSNRQK